MAATNETRAVFIRSALQFLQDHNLDGMSLSWLYPGSRPKYTPKSDKLRFTYLLEEINDAFEKNALKMDRDRYILSATVSSDVTKMSTSYEIAKLSEYVDNVDVIVNSLWGYWKHQTGT